MSKGSGGGAAERRFRSSRYYSATPSHTEDSNKLEHHSKMTEARPPSFFGSALEDGDIPTFSRLL